MANTEKDIQILGVKIDCREKKEIYRDIEDILKARRNAKIFTPNGEILYKIQNNKAAQNQFNTADLSLPDGISIQIGAVILRKRIPSKASGIDAAEFIIRYAERNRLSLYLLGGKNGVADAASDELKRRYPDIHICGTHHGYFTPDSDEEKTILKDIRKAAPDILFVCLGAPAQEEWITQNTPSLPSLRLSMGLGGCLDIWSGNKKRAPKAVRAIGLEWLYRILQAPSRIKRLPNLTGYLASVIKQALTKEVKINQIQKNKGYRT